ncbi:MAG TPA: HEAT repeat domain-containing protein [Vicinamibacteria bacterium]
MRMTLAGAVAASWVALAVTATADAPPHLANARVETRSAAGGLEAAFRSAVAAARAPAWIGYEVPAEGRHQMCCWDSTDAVGLGCPGCRLEGHGGFTVSGDRDHRSDRALSLEGDTTILVLFRAEQGRLDRIRSYSAGCALDAGGLPVVWLTDVRPADSVKLLRSLAASGGSEEKGGRWVEEPALAALAFHADASALEALIGLARQDARGHVRGQALFWLAQRAGSKVAGVITRAIEDDPETDVKKRAVFALSQLPHDEGVPLLIDTARKNRNPAVRKQAMFWLGQSNDARALAFFEEILQP